MSINRPELIDIITKKGNISKSAASESLKLVLDSISEALEQGNDVTIKGFGTFKITELAARTGRNPPLPHDCIVWFIPSVPSLTKKNLFQVSTWNIFVLFSANRFKSNTKLHS